MRHWSISSYHFDLGNMHQAVYNTSQGRFLEVTDPNRFHQSNRLAYHFDPILAAMAPLYWVYPGAEVLIIVQALALVLAAVPIYLIAVLVLKKRIYGLAFALLYLMYYPMHFTALADFHAVTVSTLFLLWMFYFGEIRKFTLSALFIVLIWTTKENAALVTAFFGLYHLVIKKNRSFGISVFSASIVAFGIIMKMIIPSFRTIGEHFAGGYYSTDIVENLRRLFRIETGRYIQSLLNPLLWTSLLSPIHLLIAFPEWMINILSRNGNMRVLNYHYTALLTPFLMISSIYGLNNAKKWVKSLKNAHFQKLFIPVTVEILVCVAVLICFIKSPLFSSEYHINSARRETIAYWQNQLHDDMIPVSATGHLSPYFSGRKYFYNFLYDFAYGAQGYTSEDIKALAHHYRKAEYVLIQKSEVTTQDMVKYYYHELQADPLYQKIFDENDIEVYKRKM